MIPRSSRRGRAAAAGLAAVLLGFVCAQPQWAQQSKPTDYQVEAVYLTKFGRFVEWPAAARGGDDKFTICVIGQDPLGAALDNAVQGETIGRAAVAARRITKVEDVTGCKVLFIPVSEDGQVKAILAALSSQSVLTVSDANGFTRRGGMIQFVIDGNRVRFEVNLAAARQASLTLSSDLLKLATSIRRAP